MEQRGRFEENVAELVAALQSAIRGEVRFDDGSRALYSADASNYRQIPIGVVLPRSVEDILETVRIFREFGAPVLDAVQLIQRRESVIVAAACSPGFDYEKLARAIRDAYEIH